MLLNLTLAFSYSLIYISQDTTMLSEGLGVLVDGS